MELSEQILRLLLDEDVDGKTAKSITDQIISLLPKTTRPREKPEEALQPKKIESDPKSLKNFPMGNNPKKYS